VNSGGIRVTGSKACPRLPHIGHSMKEIQPLIERMCLNAELGTKA